MRITTTFLLIGLASLAAVSQPSEEFELVKSCSSVKSFQQLMKNQEDIIQSPLLWNYDVKFYHFDLSISRDTTFLSGSVEYLAQVTASILDTFVVELIDAMVVDSILFNGINHDYFRNNNEIFIPLENPVQQSGFFTCKIHYHGTPPGGEFFIGVSKGYSEAWEQSVVWTLSEPFNARQWWPAKQVLEDKADSVWVFLTTDASCKAGSIGLLEGVVSLPGNKVRYEWKSRYPIAYYLISYAVADYQDYSIYSKPSALSGDSILIQNFIYDSPGCLEQYKQGIDNTVTMVELFSDLFTLYPFYEEKYGHCLTQLSGGMEHQTMTTIGQFGFGLVSHELAHMWFGDNVTCATWSDIWINEGFATYSDYLAHEFIAGSQWTPIWLNNAHYYVISQPAGSVYVPPDEIYYGNEGRIFSSRLSYYKGAYLLHMIRYELDDDELFFSVLKNFQETFGDSIAGSQDFIEILNATTDRDFTVFFDQWLFGEGYPIYKMDWVENDGLFEITAVQSTSAADVTPFFEMKYPVKIFMSDGTDTTIQIEQMQPLTVKTVNLGKGVDSIQIDPDLWVLKRVDSINGISASPHLNKIEIYPNPANEYLVIVSPGNAGIKGAIHNIQGQEIFQFSHSGPITTLDIRSLKGGIYLISTESSGSKEIHKFIKFD